MESKKYLTSVSESLKLQPRKRVKLYHSQWDEEEGDEEALPAPLSETAGGSALPVAEKWEPNEGK